MSCWNCKSFRTKTLNRVDKAPKAETCISNRQEIYSDSSLMSYRNLKSLGAKTLKWNQQSIHDNETNSYISDN